MSTSERECLAALREAAENLGKPPTKAEYEDLGLRPASTTIMRVVGGWNEAKEKAGLELYEQGQFGGREIQPKPAHVEIPEDEKWEELSAQQRWYYQNRDRRVEIKEIRRKELKRWYYELKRDELACERCDEDRPPVLDLHHPNDKEKNVSKMVNDGYSRERIREEIGRCTVLCTNCHRVEHNGQVEMSGFPDLREVEETAKNASKYEARRLRRMWVTAYKYHSDGCNRCDVSQPTCLDFHHENEKTRTIAAMLSWGQSLPEIQREIEKCELLCANCHRQIHFEPPT